MSESETPADYTPLGSGHGLWQFDPATLTQRRPVPLPGQRHAIHNESSVSHERAHWLQTCGSTIGSLYLTLQRAEDICASWLIEADKPKYDTSTVGRRLADGVPLGVDLLEDTRISLATALHIRGLSEVRYLKALLLDSVNRPLPTSFSGTPAEQIAVGLSRAETAYSFHTGGDRPWRWGGNLNEYFDLKVATSATQFEGKELTTRHLFEASALLNEWGPALYYVWFGTNTDYKFGPIPADHTNYRNLRNWQAYLSDRLAGLSNRYRFAFEIAVSKLFSQEPSPALDAEIIARTAPTVACCLDLALNPPVPPICPATRITWDEFHAPARFIRALDAVGQVGLMDNWPNPTDYVAYRDVLLRRSGLPLGSFTKRSFQHPKFEDEYFRTITTEDDEDDLLFKSSYFDFLIWCMEGIHESREVSPLFWIFPWQRNSFVAGQSADSFSFMSRSFSATPLIWEGDEAHKYINLSTDFAELLWADVLLNFARRALVSTVGTIELTDFFPKEIIEDELLQEGILKRLATEELVESLKDRLSFEPRAEDPARDDEIFREPFAPRTIRNDLDISRFEVETLDLTRVIDYIESLRVEPLANAQTVEISFSGYDGQALGLWDMADVVDYLRIIRERLPMWAWYVYAEPNLTKCPTFLLFFLSSLDDPRRVEVDAVNSFLREAYLSINQEARTADADLWLIEAISRDVYDALNRAADIRLG